MSQEYPKLYHIMTFNDFEIYFTGKVYGDSMIELIHALKKCESTILENENNTNPFGEYIKTPIRLYIYCSGGLTIDTFVVTDQMRMLKVPIHTIVFGMTASSGTLLSCVGTRRYITRNAYMLIHGPLFSDAKGNIIKSGYDNSNYRGINWTDTIIRHYVKYTKMTYKEIEEIFKSPDRYMSPEECLEKGLVDEIID